uniref:E3 ubiquitin-protein ligase n=1 Tax=Photinus pyralis TaxID=7054 RepID=A0A1Y1MDW2_PHOPY
MLYWLSYVMAEGSSQADMAKEAPQEKHTDNIECAVCLQPCIHPAQLPCGHIFCFLCVKGIANQSKRCAMCRQEIPRDFIEHPKLLHGPEAVEGFDGGYQWFYEGRNGWWQYDPRTNEDIEEAFKLNYSQFQILICGETYVIDFENKVQYPKKNPSRKRFIKRDTSDNIANFKGIAGINK